ncbi:Hypothetical protein MELLADRAFT_112941 [Melampsora larici-populina 98AG31]|uniref:Lipid droplet-associated hydrolase n=1 Tax=Melampsora larici-populina (strain 98AG31 / pathotype 3-4-7) TaxID=747676 RepID=F4S866_MELLP|nr:Hypothetical protein MELLADRAFT_112941 [Melampsora larici-populina 98AG31]EGF99132.1 Hypothetical protein MELLADRAFT_112941 [Melampsora larici-populina 98AG31]
MPDKMVEEEPSKLVLPVRSSFSWKPSLYPPGELHIWSTSLSETFSFGTKPNQIDDLKTSTNPPEVLIILIPGNPGLVEFYDEFLNNLYENLSSKNISNQIVCVGHLGHSLNQSNSDLRYLKNFNLFSEQDGYANLKDQIRYHQDFVERIGGLVDLEKTKVVLIGHSVGAHIAAKVLEKHPKIVHHLYGLFPTLSQIGSTGNGKSMSPMFWPISLPILHCVQLLLSLILPRGILLSLVNLITLIGKPKSERIALSINNLNTATQLVINSNTVAAALIMARWEMKEILEIDERFIKTYRQKISLYWTEEGKDLWVNEEEIVKLQNLLDSSLNDEKKQIGIDQDEGNVEGTEGRALPRVGLLGGQRWERSTVSEGIPHGFCLEYNEIMAEKCASWIENLLKVSTT